MTLCPGGPEIRRVDTLTGCRYIVEAPGVRGGHPRVDGTRIGGHDVISYLLLGVEVDAIQQRLPDLTRAQIYGCLAYYEDHKAAVEALALDQLE